MNQNNDKEFEYGGMAVSGFAMVCVAVVIALLLAASVTCLVEIMPDLSIVANIVLLVSFVLCCMGFFTQQPNQARVMIFFGNYRGTFRKTGFYWVNPFMSKKKISLRIRNMDIAPIKVNDKVGNPVMIGMVLVWKVRNTYRCVFDVDSDDSGAVALDSNGKPVAAQPKNNALDNFVRIQSDAALREVTSHFAYDNDLDNHDEVTLRGAGSTIVELLEEKLNERLSMAGIEVVEARLNYLAYAPEIAAVMLRRQQASAIISAREKIVEGAVSMVKMALDQLKAEGVVELDEERKATMVSNLLVVLCADEPAQPVVNTGSLYQ